MCVCVFETEKSSPEGAVVHQRSLKKECRKAHTSVGRNSPDREGNKITRGFRGKTNQRDVYAGKERGERGRQRLGGKERKRSGQVGLLHDRMRICS